MSNAEAVRALLMPEPWAPLGEIAHYRRTATAEDFAEFERRRAKWRAECEERNAGIPPRPPMDVPEDE